MSLINNSFNEETPKYKCDPFQEKRGDDFSEKVRRIYNIPTLKY